MRLLKSLDRKLRDSLDPRSWSNSELEKFAPLFSGSVVNVSGWADSDKRTGRCYRDYFSNADSYFISNYTEGYRGFKGDRKNEFSLDLTAPLPEQFKRSFDVVFNHTTLEHVFDFQMACRCLCDLSRDIVILVVPFMQHEHSSETFGDFWRFTPMAIHELMQANGFEPVYLSNNFAPDVYVFCIASRSPGRWRALREQSGNMLDSIRSGDRATVIQRKGIIGHLSSRISRAFQTFLYDIY
jgi:hypothetical protein